MTVPLNILFCVLNRQGYRCTVNQVKTYLNLEYGSLSSTSICQNTSPKKEKLIIPTPPFALDIPELILE